MISNRGTRLHAQTFVNGIGHGIKCTDISSRHVLQGKGSFLVPAMVSCLLMEGNQEYARHTKEYDRQCRCRFLVDVLALRRSGVGEYC